MNQLRVLLLASLLLLPASRVWADAYDRMDVCNDGRLDINVATAVRSFGFGWIWQVWGWTKVSAGKCEEIFRQINFGDSEFNLAFAFTDSTGVWGGRVVKPSGQSQDLTQSNIQICAEAKDFYYRFNSSGEPASACMGEPGWFLVPASIRWVPGRGVDQDLTFHLEFDANDRAIAFASRPGGPVASPSPAPANNGPGLGSQFLKALDDAAASANIQKRARELEQAAPTPPPPHESFPTDDPIGQGGFIGPLR